MQSHRRKAPGASIFSRDWLVYREHDPRVAAMLGRFGAGRLLDVGCGERPFAGTSAIAVASAILNNPPLDLSDARVPSRLKTLVRGLLERDPAKRPQDAGRIHASLQELASTSASVTRRRYASVRWLGFVAVLLALATAGGWASRRATEAETTRLAAASGSPPSPGPSPEGQVRRVAGGRKTRGLDFDARRERLETVDEHGVGAEARDGLLHRPAVSERGVQLLGVGSPDSTRPRSARALPAAHRPARPLDRLHRGRSGVGGTLRRRHGCRSAA